MQAKIDRLNELKGQVNNNPNFSSTFKTDLIKVADNAIDAGTCTKNTTPSTLRKASSERVLDCNVVLNEKESYISKYYKLSIVASNLQPSGGTLPADVASLSYFTLTRMVDKFPLIPSSEIKPVVEFVDAAGNTVKRLSGYFIGDNRYASYSDNGDADLFFVNGRWYYRKLDLGLESLYYYEPTTRKWINFVPADFPTENFYEVMQVYGPGLAAFADKWEKVVVGVCGVFLGAPVLQFGRWGLTYYLANQGLQVGMTAFRDDFKAKFGPTVMVKYDLIQVSLILSSIYQIALSNNVVKIGNDNITTQITTANNYIRTQIPAINNAIATVEAKIASTPALFANYKDKIDNVLNKIKAWINANTANLLIKNRDELGVFLDQVDETYTVNMLTGKGIKSLFRGTTRRGTDNALFPGSTSTQENGIPTSVDPVKATIFAIESQTYCARNYPEYNKASVIIGLPDNFVGIKCASPSRRVFEELEVAIGTSANNYANVSSVEISVDNARKLVKSLYDITLPATLSRAEADALMFNRVYESPSLDKSFLFYQKSIPFNIK